ncbi:MAG TPA: AI-2E family transporter [Candidatus Kaiserbacteria bacterium]|nr:AI-2E family transporter [Candidatus Kaiserbacteria bacterium]
MSDNAKQLVVNITTGTIIKAILLVVLFIALFYLKDLVLVILTSVVIASAIEPATRWFVKYKFPRLVAVMIVYLLFLTFLLGFFYFFLPPVLSEVINFLAVLPDYLDKFDSSSPFQESVLLGTQSVVDTFSIANIITGLRTLFSNVSESFLATITLVFGGVFSFILIIVFSFYFAVQETGIDDFLRVISPVKYQKNIINLWRRSQVKIGLWMQGQIILAVIVGVLVYLGLMILEVRYALLLAVIAAVFELIPVFGPILSSIPAIMIGFVDGGATAGLLVIGLYIIIQQFENHLIYPLVVTKVVGVPPLLVILALLIGAQLAGFLGVILAVPIAAVIQELVSDIQRKKEIGLDKEESPA